MLKMLALQALSYQMTSWLMHVTDGRESPSATQEWFCGRGMCLASAVIDGESVGVYMIELIDQQS